jgi:hypothetical protein
MTHRIAEFKPAPQQLTPVGKHHLFDTQFWQFLCHCIQTGTPSISTRKNLFSHFFSLRFSLQNDMQLQRNNMAEMTGMAYWLHFYFLTCKTNIL